MARHSQRHRSTSLPFRHYEEGLSFEIEEYRLNGRKPTVLDLAPGQTTIDVAPTSPSESAPTEDKWDWVVLYGSLEVPQNVITDLFPSEERDSPPAKLYVAVRCHETIYRDRVFVEEAPTTAGEYEVKIHLDWNDFRGSVELRPYLTRTTDRDGDDQFASTSNVKVASGPRYEVVVDHWDDDDPAMIDGEEVSFSDEDHLPDGNNLYYLDFRNEARPKLWIDADSPRLADILRTEGSVGAEPRMRDVILDEISYGVWSQLIVRAIAAIDRNGDVEYEWQQTVLEAFALDLCNTDDMGDAKQLLRKELRDPDGVARLVTRMDSELQEFVDPGSQLINLVEEGLRI